MKAEGIRFSKRELSGINNLGRLMVDVLAEDVVAKNALFKSIKNIRAFLKAKNPTDGPYLAFDTSCSSSIVASTIAFTMGLGKGLVISPIPKFISSASGHLAFKSPTFFSICGKRYEDSSFAKWELSLTID